MVYVVGIIGFILGIIFGQMILYFLLRHKTREELLKDKNLKYTYGLLYWIVAGLFAYLFVFIYTQYYPST